MPLFQVAILEMPTKKEAEEGAAEKLVFGPTAVVARDAQSAAIAAVTQDGATLDRSKADRWQVLIAPFVA